MDPVGDGMLDTCGHSVTYTWEFTDQCSRTISHSQTVTVEPIPEASFVNPPGCLVLLLETTHPVFQNYQSIIFCILWILQPKIDRIFVIRKLTS